MDYGHAPNARGQVKVVRVFDRNPGRRGEVHARRSDRDDPSREQAGRPTVYQRFYYYWCGEGWHRALRHVALLLQRGGDRATVAQNVGWRLEELESALRGERPKPAPPCRCFDTGHGPHVQGCAMSGWRESQQRETRPARRNDPSPELMLKARRMYEDGLATVPEVAEEFDMSRGRAYLILVKAGTTFRRRGRRLEGQGRRDLEGRREA